MKSAQIANERIYDDAQFKLFPPNMELISISARGERGERLLPDLYVVDVSPGGRIWQ